MKWIISAVVAVIVAAFGYSGYWVYEFIRIAGGR